MKALLQLYFVSCYLLCYAVKAQINLIPNGSFEEIISCPEEFINIQGNNLNLATPWWNSNRTGELLFENISSPNLFSVCSQTVNPLNNTIYGIQEPQEGSCIAGLVTYTAVESLQEGSSNWGEYIETKLNSSIYPNKIYELSLYLSLSDNLSLFNLKRFFAAFTADSLLGLRYLNTDDNLSSVFPSLNPADLVEINGLDSVPYDAWQEVKVIFSPQTTSNYITLGAFQSNKTIQQTFDRVLFRDPPPFGVTVASHTTYYFIDNISLIEIGDVGLNTLEVEKAARVYPNPAKSSLNIYISTNQEETLTEIIDIYGRVVLTKQLGNAELNMLDISSISTGWYLVRITRLLSGSFVQSVFIEH